ncbi:hypothetical protein Bbelb_258430 [Branchiostoma belcheri]|nr:hypothetical protein Bbelb_258430 [Branchiostoma belcheri]
MDKSRAVMEVDSSVQPPPHPSAQVALTSDNLLTVARWRRDDRYQRDQPDKPALFAGKQTHHSGSTLSSLRLPKLQQQELCNTLSGCLLLSLPPSVWSMSSSPLNHLSTRRHFPWGPYGAETGGGRLAVSVRPAEVLLSKPGETDQVTSKHVGQWTRPTQVTGGEADLLNFL